MKFNVNGTEKEITLKVWNGNQYSYDCFGDVETSLKYPREEGGTALICTEEEYQELVKFWEKECKMYNEDGWSECFGDKPEGKTDEFVLFAD